MPQKMLKMNNSVEQPEACGRTVTIRCSSVIVQTASAAVTRAAAATTAAAADEAAAEQAIATASSFALVLGVR